MSTKLLGRPVAESIKQDILQRIEVLGVRPTIATVGFESDLEWEQYASSVARASSSYKCNVINYSVKDDCTVEQLAQLIDNLNNDNDIDGILLQQPLPREFAHLVNDIVWYKDIDGLSNNNTNALYNNDEQITPATPSAVIQMLDYYNYNVQGKHIVVIGRGRAVGKPLALMLTNRNATVTLCHSKTVNLQEIAKSADIIVSCCGVGNLIDQNYVNNNCVVIDVGLSFDNGIMSGDINQSEIDGHCLAFSPVPNGIGPVTRACLFNNAVKCATLR